MCQLLLGMHIVPSCMLYVGDKCYELPALCIKDDTNVLYITCKAGAINVLKYYDKVLLCYLPSATSSLMTIGKYAEESLNN